MSDILRRRKEGRSNMRREKRRIKEGRKEERGGEVKERRKYLKY